MFHFSPSVSTIKSGHSKKILDFIFKLILLLENMVINFKIHHTHCVKAIKIGENLNKDRKIANGYRHHIKLPINSSSTLKYIYIYDL